MKLPPAERFQDLIVWQKAHALTLHVYKLTKAFPREELFGLTSQMRRSAVSVAANIAEGFSKKSRPDKARILNISQASLEELRYFFILAKDLCYIDQTVTWPDVDEVARLLGAYVKTVSQPPPLAPSS